MHRHDGPLGMRLFCGLAEKEHRLRIYKKSASSPYTDCATSYSFESIAFFNRLVKIAQPPLRGLPLQSWGVIK